MFTYHRRRHWEKYITSTTLEFDAKGRNYMQWMCPEDNSYEVNICKLQRAIKLKKQCTCWHTPQNGGTYRYVLQGGSRREGAPNARCRNAESRRITETLETFHCVIILLQTATEEGLQLTETTVGPKQQVRYACIEAIYIPPIPTVISHIQQVSAARRLLQTLTSMLIMSHTSSGCQHFEKTCGTCHTCTAGKSRALDSCPHPVQSLIYPLLF